MRGERLRNAGGGIIDASVLERPHAPGARRQPRPSDALVGAASFLLVLGLLLLVLLGRGLAPSVPEGLTVTRSVATDATVLVPGESSARRGVALTRTSTVETGIAPVPDADAYTVSTSTRTSGGAFVGRDRFSAVQQRTDGRVVASPADTALSTTLDVNGNAVQESRPLRDMSGLLLRFPLSTPESDQQRWDPVTRTAGTAEYVGRARLLGSPVLRFVQRSSSTAADVRTSARTSLWVRPETGTVVRQDTDVLQRRADGTVVLRARFVETPESVRRTSAEVDRLVDRHRLLGTLVPGAVLVAGMMAVTAAVLEGRTRWLEGRLRRRRPEEGQ